MSDLDWKRIEPTVVTQVGYRKVVSKTFELPNGKTHHFETVSPEGRRAAGVVALTPDNKVIIAYQFRVGPEKMMYEIPGGGVDEGEDESEGAKRELLEETGYEPEAFEHLGTVYKEASNNCTWDYYFATGCKLHKDGQQLDEHEFIEVRLISIGEFINNAKTGKMTDPDAVFLAYDKLLKLKDAGRR